MNTTYSGLDLDSQPHLDDRHRYADCHVSRSWLVQCAVQIIRLAACVMTTHPQVPPNWKFKLSNMLKNVRTICAADSAGVTYGHSHCKICLIRLSNRINQS